VAILSRCDRQIDGDMVNMAVVFILTWTVLLVIRFNNSLLKPLPYVRELPLTVGINADVRHLLRHLCDTFKG
jgi:hypothetical protein